MHFVSGTVVVNKTDEFSEKFQTAFDKIQMSLDNDIYVRLQESPGFIESLRVLVGSDGIRCVDRWDGYLWR